MKHTLENAPQAETEGQPLQILTLGEVQSLVDQEFNVIPLIETIGQRENAGALYERLRGDGPSFLLESADPAEHQGRYSFIGLEPDAVIRLEKEGMMVNGVRHDFEDPYQFVEDFLGQRKVAHFEEDLPPFFGGAAGLFGYDLARYIEPSIGAAKEDPLDLPELALIVPGVTIAIDTYSQTVSIIKNIVVPKDADSDTVEHLYDAARDSIQNTRANITDHVEEKRADPPTYEQMQFASNMTAEEYKDAVKAAIASNVAGDTFQVVPSQRFSSDKTVDRDFAQEVFGRLKQDNPSRYGFLFEFEDFQVTGCSPETLVKVTDGNVECMAIAGTRKRGETKEEDAELTHDLANDEKERAEHYMLVDLCRNDMNTVCDAESVGVDPNTHLAIENYSHVMHMTSRVVGRLREGMSALRALAHIAPAGTLSGAPKISAMQVIDRLEPDKRGFYGGAVGYVNYEGGLDSCIFIRSVLVDREGRVHVQAGAGVVADSVPESELKETYIKAGAPLKAIDEVCNPRQRHQRPNCEKMQSSYRRSQPERIGKRVLLIDNYDSFTFNIRQYLEKIGADVDVVRNDDHPREILHARPDLLVISPGPHTPKEAGISLEAVKYFPELGIPTLGICLGHQALAMAFGGEVGLHRPMHGKTSSMKHDGKTIFTGVTNPMQVMRYHSLVAHTPLPLGLEESASTIEEDGEKVIMAIRHTELPLEGVQFHPESECTPSGMDILANFVLLERA